MSDEPARGPLSEMSDHDDADSTGITPSTSASSDMSTLPPFPDVPTHTYQLPTSNSCQSGVTVDPDQVEIVLSDASSIGPSPITPTFSYSYHPATPPKANHLKHAHRFSLTSSSTSDQSHYEDAREDPSRASIDEATPHSPQEPKLELSKQQTSLWVLDTLASTIPESAGRPLSDIGETEEPEEVLRDGSCPLPPPVKSVQVVDSFIPRSPSAGSLQGQSPSMAAIQRCDSPTFSQRSRSTTSSAPVSYTAPKRTPVASTAPMKTKNTFGKKITSLFGGGPSYNAAALGLRGNGISSRDVVGLGRSSQPQMAEKQSSRKGGLPSKPSSDLSFTRPSSETHSRTHSHSSSSYSTFPPIPTTPQSFSNATFAALPRSSGPPSTTESESGANKLADMLSKFEQEEKARFKGIAESRLGKSASDVVVA
ncbi:uncharacterized protein JCM6883_001691 [Sporobolomyces salmoneus]|uniref:uncharacterized protein n=1 Tax=Sporobolomyces salmoneus TaxID=183962 RepID=UPI0031705F47